MMTRDPYRLQLSLDEALDRLQHLSDTLAAIIHAAGGTVTIRPENAAAARGNVVQFDATQDDRVVVTVRERRTNV